MLSMSHKLYIWLEISHKLHSVNNVTQNKSCRGNTNLLVDCLDFTKSSLYHLRRGDLQKMHFSNNQITFWRFKISPHLKITWRWLLLSSHLEKKCSNCVWSSLVFSYLASHSEWHCLWLFFLLQVIKYWKHSCRSSVIDTRTYFPWYPRSSAPLNSSPHLSFLFPFLLFLFFFPFPSPTPFHHNQKYQKVQAIDYLNQINQCSLNLSEYSSQEKWDCIVWFDSWIL